MATEFELQVLTELGEIKAICATNAAKQEESEHRLDSLDRAQTQNWWLSVCIAPALALAHGAVRKLGVNI
jgi:hypothetical protein